MLSAGTLPATNGRGCPRHNFAHSWVSANGRKRPLIFLNIDQFERPLLGRADIQNLAVGCRRKKISLFYPPSRDTPQRDKHEQVPNAEQDP